MLSHAATPVSCATLTDYQDQLGQMIVGADYVEDMQDFTDSGGDVMTYSTSELKRYGRALNELADDMQKMKHVDPKMKPYHVATYTLFSTLGAYMIDASTMGVMSAALVYQDQMTEVTDTYERE